MKSVTEYMNDILQNKLIKGIRPTLLSKKTGISLSEAVNYLDKLVLDGKLSKGKEYNCPVCCHTLHVVFYKGKPDTAECCCCNFYSQDAEEILLCREKYPLYKKV